MKIRQATVDDLPAVVKVILAAINSDRLWAKFVPAKNTQDEPYVQEIVTLLREHLDPANKDWEVEVVDLADKGAASNIVSVAVWDLSTAGDAPKPTREVKTAVKDSRLDAYVNVVQGARAERFGRYANKHNSYLQLLATHPQHQRRGYARELVQAAIVQQKHAGGVLTAVGGPLGYIFFSGLGFHDLGAVTLPPSSATADESADIKALSLEVPKEERRTSLVESLRNYLVN